MNFKTTTLAKTIDIQISKYPGRIDSLVRDFLEEFIVNLNSFRIERPADTYSEFGKQLLDNFTEILPLRDDYLHFLDKFLKSGIEFNTDILISFFEKLTGFLYPDENEHQWSSNRFVNYQFIINELFMYTIALLLKRENYKVLEDLLHSKYFISNHHASGNEPKNYSQFNYYVDAIDQYYSTINGGQRYLNAQADLLVKRLPEGFKKADFIEGDLLCYYVGKLNGVHWFPKTYIYKNDYSNIFIFFNRLISKKHFDRIKGVLGVNTIEELKKSIENLDKEDHRGYSNGRGNITRLSEYVKVEKIGTER